MLQCHFICVWSLITAVICSKSPSLMWWIKTWWTSKFVVFVNNCDDFWWKLLFCKRYSLCVRRDLIFYLGTWQTICLIGQGTMRPRLCDLTLLVGWFPSCTFQALPGILSWGLSQKYIVTETQESLNITKYRIYKTGLNFCLFIRTQCINNFILVITLKANFKLSEVIIFSKSYRNDRYSDQCWSLLTWTWLKAIDIKPSFRAVPFCREMFGWGAWGHSGRDLLMKLYR